MDWIQSLNKAIVYIEEHMTEEIDYVQVAKIAACSSYHFQRMFTYVADVSLTEYIKRRKMTLAAVDLQSGDKKIIDVAVKYGYSSPTAFNRAFQAIHGIAPSLVKKDGVLLKSYPPISFQLTAKGVEKMEFRIEKKDAIRILGLSTPLANEFDKAHETIDELWMKVLTEGAPKNANGDVISYGDEGSLLGDLRKIRNVEPKGMYGITILDCEPNEANYDVLTFGDCKYLVGVSSTSSQGMFEEFIIPAHTWAVFPGKGGYSNEDELRTFGKRIYTEWLPTSGYKLNGELEIEFILPQNKSFDIENAPLEIWIPVIKR